MHQKFLGDSYDLVKRFWAEKLKSVAPIYAHEAFVPEQIREDYSQITGIPIFNSTVKRPFAIFLDPCTGIPSPRNRPHKPSEKYAPLQFVIDVFKKYHPEFLICFDQSYRRGANKGYCMEEKMNALTVNGLCAFYYASHANFLFVSKSATTIDAIMKRLLDLGIPSRRLKPNK